ncbi:hypothetical protein L202_04625 [Cryptococcus amylolentus CBS 6039]|uniref:Hyaluronan-mediated motility receptor C-terminal domain-containing protein n=1 Tax=Cryptococcus amylolentus CBS 6039 TaxID=1295533 RepID=A0A1E3HM71_9TREE|nr:hypothetical protein L202_04625 [Cryptococcus amylolentus CBS 6039]ODN77447.1 hypothetical protein L202_04625 [Cryptococcus amylolentus CBS 6039]
MSVNQPSRTVLVAKPIVNVKPDNNDPSQTVKYRHRSPEKNSQDLGKAKSKIERRDATIKQLQSQIQALPNPSIIDSLQKQLKDLEARHQASKGHESKRHEWEQYAKKVKQERDSLRIRLEEKDKKMEEDARATSIANAEAQRLKDENKSLKPQLSHNRSSQPAQSITFSNFTKRSNDYRAQLSMAEAELRETYAKLSDRYQAVYERDVEFKKFRIKMDGQVESLKRDLEEVKRERDERAKEVERLEEDKKRVEAQLAEEEGRCENLEDLLDASARAYALHHMATVPKASFDTLQYEHLRAKHEAADWRLKAETRGVELQMKKDEIKELEQRLEVGEEEKNVLGEAFDTMREDGAVLREEIDRLIGASISGQRSDFSYPTLDPLPSVSPAFQLALSHSDLITSHFLPQVTSLTSDISSLQSKLSTTTSNLTSSQTSLADLKREHASLHAAHTSLKTAHEPCASIKLELEKSELECALNAKSIEGLREEVAMLKMKAKEDSEGMKRANDCVMRAKVAEQSLVEEIDYLREVYLEASKYESLYTALQEEHEILIAREQAAVQEAEDIARQNAELAGHTNEVQKISYVEGLRREMVEVKQELAGTRQMLNISYDKINALEAEIGAYKSLDSGVQGLNLGASGRMKVQRRQPEGGRLTVSRLSKSVAGSRSSRN